MRTVLVALMTLGLGLAAAGCGSNDCEDAADKLDECGFDLGDSTPSDDDTKACHEKDECSAKCVLAGSCADIKAAQSGETNSVSKCWAACPL